MADNPLLATPTADTFDFQNPFVAAAIITADQKRYPLWTRGPDGETFDIPGAPGGGSLKALSFLTETVIQINLGYVPQLQITLNPPYEDAVKFLDSELIEFGKNQLQVQFGYARGAARGGQLGAILSLPLQGFFNQPPEVSFGPQISITMRAQGFGGGIGLDKQTGAKTFDGTFKDAINEIGKRHNMEVQFLNLDKSSEVQKLLDGKCDEQQAWRTDELMLQFLSNRVKCFVRMVRSTNQGKGIIEVFPRAFAYAHGTPDHTLALYHYPNGQIGNGVYPILSASTPTNAVWLPGIRATLLREIDDKTKKETRAVATIDPSLLTSISQNIKTFVKTVIGDTGTSPPEAKGDGKAFNDPHPVDPIGYHHIPGDPAFDKSVETMKSAFEQFKATAMGITLDAETIGVPTIEPGHVVAVRGLGMRLDRDNYCVHAVTHTLGTSGFTTQLRMVNSTNPILAQQIQVASSGVDQNKEQPQDSGSNKGTAQSQKQ